MLLLKHVEGIFYRTYYEFINEFYILHFNSQKKVRSITIRECQKSPLFIIIINNK